MENIEKQIKGTHELMRETFKILKSKNDFMKDFIATGDLPHETEDEKYYVAKKQENLLVAYSQRYCDEENVFRHDKSQNVNYSANKKHGDLMFNGRKIDLKVSEKGKEQFVSTLTKSSVDGFSNKGGYLVCNLTLTKMLLIPKKHLLEKIDSNELVFNESKRKVKTPENSYIKGCDIMEVFGKEYEV